jgi:hypothetical protein
MEVLAGALLFEPDPPPPPPPLPLLIEFAVNDSRSVCVPILWLFTSTSDSTALGRSGHSSRPTRRSSDAAGPVAPGGGVKNFASFGGGALSDV